MSRARNDDGQVTLLAIVFTMLALMTLVGPFLYGIGRIDAIAGPMKTDQIAWSAPVLGVLAAEIGVIAIAILVAGWVHARKPSFL